MALVVAASGNSYEVRFLDKNTGKLLDKVVPIAPFAQGWQGAGVLGQKLLIVHQDCDYFEQLTVPGYAEIGKIAMEPTPGVTCRALTVRGNRICIGASNGTSKCFSYALPCP